MSGSPVVPTGAYKIINVGDKLAASLIDGSVVGSNDGGSNAIWFVENVESGVENQVVFRNVGTSSFAGVTQALVGEPVVGTSTATVWTLKSVQGGTEITVDGLAWTLISSSENNPILLEPATGSVSQLWFFEAVPQA